MKSKDKIALTFTGILVLCALFITGLVIRQEFFPPEPEPEIQQVENWQQLELNGRRLGPADASVQIVEFFDYQCPFCKSVQPAVKAVREKYSGRISVRHEHFPLSGHEHAFEAAVAAECAAKQDQFKAYHELLFANQDRLGDIRYDSLALETGIKNITSFNKCLESGRAKSIVDSGLELGEDLGVDGIPTFIINGKLVSGALSEQQLDRFVQAALDERSR